MIAITGARGYVGSALNEALQRAGYSTLPMGRGMQAESGIDFELSRASELQFPDGVTVLIHCAWDLQQARWDDIGRVNVQGSKNLFVAAKEAGVRRILFISSMAAFEGCASMYGKAKLDVEKAVQDLNGIVVRPGTVWGDPLSGILGAVDGLVSKLPVVPVIGSGKQPLFCIHKDDLAQVIVKLVDESTTKPDGVISAAHPEPIPFGEIIRLLAKRRNRKVILFPLPSVLISTMLKIAEVCKLPLGLRSDSVTSLNSLNREPDFSAMDGLNIPLRHLLD